MHADNKLPPPDHHPSPSVLPAQRPVRGPVRRVVRFVLIGFAAVYFAAAFLMLATRYLVLPQVDSYRDDIARQLSQTLGLTVHIGHIDTHWYGLRPHLDLGKVEVLDAQGRRALALDLVRTSLSWTTLLVGELRLHQLEIDGPSLYVRRDAEGRLFVAGVEITPQQGGPALSDWVLAQHEIVVRNASLHWDDALRGAPPLSLTSVNLRLVNRGSHHLFGVSAAPPEEVGGPIDLRGDFRGRSLQRLEEWEGEAYFAADQTDLAAWRAWVDYPYALTRGSGSLRLWLGVAGLKIVSATADLDLSQLRIGFRDDVPPLDASMVKGRISGRYAGGVLTASGRQFALALSETGGEEAPGGESSPAAATPTMVPAAPAAVPLARGVRIEPMNFQLRVKAADASHLPQIEISSDRLDLEPAAQLAAALPIGDEPRRVLTQMAPHGRLEQLSLSWSGVWSAPAAYTLRTRFSELGMSAYALLPGFSGLSGMIDASQSGGSASVSSRKAELDFPRVFAESRIPLSQFDANARWSHENGRLSVSFPKIEFANADAAGSFSGVYRTRAPEAHTHSPGEIDLTGHLTRADVGAVPRYVPLIAAESVRDWVAHALSEGRSDDVRVRLKGDLWEFPWARDKEGLFEVKVRMNGTRLAYAQGWPEFTGIAGDVLFHGERVTVRARTGNFGTVKLSEVQADIPDLVFDAETVLKLKGKAEGPTAEFLRFVAASPLAARSAQFVEGLQVAGDGNLNLDFVMPLNHVSDTRTSGEFQFAGNQLALSGLPPLADAGGTLSFSEKGLSLRNGQARLLGAPLSISGTTREDGSVAFETRGSVSASDLRTAFDQPLLDHLSGTTPWRGTVIVDGKGAKLSIDSDLQGIASSLPDPLNKPAAGTLPLHVELAKTGEGNSELRATLDGVADVRLLGRREGERTVFDRGGIGVREAPPASERGLAFAAKLDTLDIDAWRKLFPVAAGPAGAGDAPVGGASPWSAITLRANTLAAFGQHFHAVDLHATQTDGTWQTQVTSKEINGELSWRDAERGRLRARLKSLALGEVNPPSPAATAQDKANIAVSQAEKLRELPAVDVVADSFSLHGKNLGKLELLATNRGNTWQIDKFAISNPEATVSGDGQWVTQTGGAGISETYLSFKLEAEDVGKLLDRFGYANTVRRGTATLGGKVSWRGAPTSIDYPSLSGSLTLDAAKGQFNRLEPGVGRLLGVLSLQSLSRRITLDFRDVFSDGFAFDSISGSMKVARGVMSTDDLRIRGPSARVQMEGETNLAAETQDLHVTVQPTLSEGVALGAAIVNPIAGAAALVAQKVLKDPIEKMFAYEYSVSGSWSDPQVSKVASAQPAAPAEKP